MKKPRPVTGARLFCFLQTLIFEKFSHFWENGGSGAVLA
jgi:hypothetical protein